VLPEAFSAEKRIPDPIPAAAVPEVVLVMESISAIVVVELSKIDAESAETPIRDDADVAILNDPAPCDNNPPLPTVRDVLAKIDPFACISLRTERLPASREWTRAEVDSRPPKSNMVMLFEL
jgi:hypothetical protein